MKGKKILIMGLTGTGKTTLASALAPMIGAVHFNADAVRALFADQDFSAEARVRQAKRMSELCDTVCRSGHHAVADFVCPTDETRKAFGADYTIFLDRKPLRRFADTEKLFARPDQDSRTLVFHSDVTAEDLPSDFSATLADRIRDFMEIMDERKPTAMFVGRWQPFHAGHKALVLEGIKRHGQVIIGIRTMPKSDSNPFDFDQCCEKINEGLADYAGLYRIVPLPNIAAIYYGRDVGYVVERLRLEPELEAVSGTKVREKLRTKGVDI